MEETIARQEELVNLFPVIDDPASEQPVTDLTLTEALTLAALFEDGESSNTGLSEPIVTRESPLAPTPSLESELIEGLLDNNRLYIHPDSALDSFVWESGTYAGRYYPSRARYYLPGSGPLEDRLQNFLRQIKNHMTQEDWPDSWHAELADLWFSLCASDCEAYLMHCLRKRSLEVTAGGKTRDIIRRGLEWYTLGQMYYFIWRSAAGAGDYYTRGNVNRSQAGNSAITRLASSINKAHAEGWAIKPYQRQSDDPSSMLWHLLAIRALNLSDPMSFAPMIRRRTTTSLRWAELDAELFERLIFTLVDDAAGYEQVQWLMRTNAPDHGRDVSAVRITKDALSGHRQFRVVVQCKHWLSRSITDKDLANEVTSIEHWENPPFDVLVMATSGRFTADAVTWCERHNGKGHRPHIELWNDAHLESLLIERQDLVLAFGLR